MIYISIFLLCFSQVVFGAAFPSTQTGDINDGGTFGNTSPGVAGTDFPNPAGGDTFTASASHVVTIPSGYTTITSGSIVGTLTVNGTFTLDADTTMFDEDAVLLGTSGAINFNTFRIKRDSGQFYKNMTITLSGTSEDHFILTGSGGFGEGNASYWEPQMIFTYCDFDSLTEFSFWDQASINATDCTFNNLSGNWYLRTEGENLDINFVRTKFVDCVPSTNFIFGTSGSETWTGSGTGIRGLIDCTFEGCRQLWLGNGVGTNNSIIYGSVYQHTSPPKEDIEFNTSMFYRDSGNDLYPIGNLTYDSCYIYTNVENAHVISNSGWSASNPDPFVVKYTIFENAHTTGDGEDVIILDNEAATANIFNNIVMNNRGGVFINSLGGATLADVSAYNNTVYSSINTYGALARTENTGLFNGTSEVFKNNIGFNKGTLGDSRFINLQNLTTADQMTYVGYNGLYNMPETIGAYYNVAISGKSFGDDGLGLGDIYTDPAFVDPTRNLATWDAYNGGNGTSLNAITEMLKLNDHDFDPNYTVENLNAHVRGGFAPTNSAYAIASDIGYYIGAVPVATSTKQYYKELEVTGTAAGEQTNYQVPITVTYEPEMNGDFSDVKFTDVDFNDYDFWLEEKTFRSTAIFWVEIPIIPVSPNTVKVRMVFGNSSITTSKSNGDNTFVFFDDFDTGAFGSPSSSKWNIFDTDTGAEIVTNYAQETQVSGLLGMQGLAADGVNFFWARSSGIPSGDPALIYKYDYGGAQITTFSGPPHSGGMDIREDHDTIVAASAEVDPYELWEISKTGTKLREWNFTDATYPDGALITYISEDTFYVLTNEYIPTYNAPFKIYKMTLNDNETIDIIDTWESPSLGRAQEIDYVDGVLYLYTDVSQRVHRIYTLALSGVDDTIVATQWLDTLPSAVEAEGLTHDGEMFFYGDLEGRIRRIFGYSLETHGPAAGDISAYIQSKNAYNNVSIFTLASFQDEYVTAAGLSGIPGSNMPIDSDDMVGIGKYSATGSYLMSRQREATADTRQSYVSNTNYYVYHKYEVRKLTDSVRYYDDGVALEGGYITDTTPSSDLYVTLGLNPINTGKTSLLQSVYIAVRNLVEVEPTVGSFGSIEDVPTDGDYGFIF